MLKNYKFIRQRWLIVPFLSAFFIFSGYGQVVLKGTVKGSDGEILPGASVQIMGTVVGAATDLSGNYSLNTSQLKKGNFTLLFKSVGYKDFKKEISVGNQTVIQTDVVLPVDALGLDEIVILGSGVKQSRKELGNSISSVSQRQIENSGTGNLLGALQGKIPGAQITQNSGDPAGSISVRLRGIKSIQGSSDPLYVIDGVVISNSSTSVSQTAVANQVATSEPGTNRLADINPNDIESINVLNGAAAAAQYGARASNGVVIITTKRAKSGAPKFSFTTSYTTSELRKKVFVSTYGKQFGFAGLRLHTIGGVSPAQITANPGTTTVGIVREGATTPLANNLVDVTRYDYQDQIFRTASGIDNNLSVTGGNDNTQYLVSFSYTKNEGIVKGTDFSRYNIRSRLDQRLSNWAKISVGLSYMNSFANEKANGNVFYSPINSINITNNLWDITQRDAQGNLQAVEPTRVNPLSTIDDMRFDTKVDRTINDIQFNFTPFKNFSINWVTGIDYVAQLGTSYIKPYPYATAAGLPAERYPNGFASNVNNNSLQINSDITLNYEQNINDFKINWLAGFNYQFLRSDFTRASGEGLAPFIETVSGASTTIGAGYGVGRYNLSGMFLQSTFSYKNLAFLTGAIRRDRSSLFSPSETNQIYPKVSASFVPSSLDGWKKSNLSNVINEAKVRFSWGASGNLTGINFYDRFWQFSPVPYLGKNTIVPSSQLANPSVRPERMNEFEYGVDLSFLNNKINLGLTFYKQAITDLVVNRTLASSEGGTSIVNSVGEMENSGMELSLGITPLKSKDLEWNLNFIYNSNRNKVTKLGSPTVSVNTVSGAPIFLVEGQPASVFYGNPYARDANGNILLTAQGLFQRERGTQTSVTDYTVGRDANGQPTGAFVRKIIGNPNPDWTGSISSDLKYKKLSLNFLVDFVQGTSVFNADKRTRNNVGIGDLAEAEMKGTAPRGTVFSLVLVEEYRVDDGSYVKLRQIALGYDLGSICKGISNARISLIGRNLISWDNYNGFDPETNAGGTSNLQRAVDFGNVPIPRSYQLQLSLNF